MAAPEIAYRIALADPAAIGGATAQHLALLVATRWAQPDGRFILRQTAIQRATGLSESTVTRSVRALQSAKVFAQLVGDEWAVSGDHLAAHDGWIRHTDGWSRHGPAPSSSSAMTDGPVSQTDPPVTDGQSRHRRPEPSVTASPVPQTERSVKSAANAVTGPKAGYRKDGIASFPSSSDITSQGEEDARASVGATAAAADDAPPADGADDLSGWAPSEAESKTLAWVNAQGLPWELADGTDLRREWLDSLRHLKPSEAKEVRKRMAGDTPAAFRRAMGAELAAVREERAAEAADAGAKAAANALQERARAEAAAVDREAEERRKREAQVVTDERARETGTYLEQARALLEEIGRADPRRLVLAESGWAAALVRLRNDVAGGRVAGVNLVRIRGGWPAIRDRQLPPEPVATTPPIDVAARVAGDEAATDPEPAEAP